MRDVLHKIVFFVNNTLIIGSNLLFGLIIFNWIQNKNFPNLWILLVTVTAYLVGFFVFFFEDKLFNMNNEVDVHNVYDPSSSNTDPTSNGSTVEDKGTMIMSKFVNEIMNYAVNKGLNPTIITDENAQAFIADVDINNGSQVKIVELSLPDGEKVNERNYNATFEFLKEKIDNYIASKANNDSEVK